MCAQPKPLYFRRLTVSSLNAGKLRPVAVIDRYYLTC